MKLDAAIADYRQKDGGKNRLGHSMLAVSRHEWEGTFYLFEWRDGFIGKVYSGLLAGIPPRVPLSAEELAAEDWEVWEMSPYMD